MRHLLIVSSWNVVTPAGGTIKKFIVSGAGAILLSGCVSVAELAQLQGDELVNLSAALDAASLEDVPAQIPQGSASYSGLTTLNVGVPASVTGENNAASAYLGDFAATVEFDGAGGASIMASSDRFVVLENLSQTEYLAFAAAYNGVLEGDAPEFLAEIVSTGERAIGSLSFDTSDDPGSEVFDFTVGEFSAVSGELTHGDTVLTVDGNVISTVRGTNGEFLEQETFSNGESDIDFFPDRLILTLNGEAIEGDLRSLGLAD